MKGVIYYSVTHINVRQVKFDPRDIVIPSSGVITPAELGEHRVEVTIEYPLQSDCSEAQTCNLAILGAECLKHSATAISFKRLYPRSDG